jgi:ubiquinone/menaquinone biosynthesis C-methylase UbiE
MRGSLKKGRIVTSPRSRHGFEAVDDENDSRWYLDCLDTQSAQPFHQDVRRTVFALLQPQPGFRVLDVGCGNGEDARALCQLAGTHGQVIGVDASATMIAEACARSAATGLPVVFRHADAAHLDLADASFDGCYSIRTFQHLDDPERALAEMVRVLRPGGRIVVADPDHQTTIMDVAERELARRFLNWRSDTIRNGWIAHHMPALMQAVGLVDISVTPKTHLSTDYAEVEATSHYEGGIQVARGEGILSAEEAQCLTAALRATAEGGHFFCATTFFITSGTRP